MGRFMSPDIINVTEERMMNPANTLNKYAYAADNPLKFIDPEGKTSRTSMIQAVSQAMRSSSHTTRRQYNMIIWVQSS